MFLTILRLLSFFISPPPPLPTSRSTRFPDPFFRLVHVSPLFFSSFSFQPALGPLRINLGPPYPVWTFLPLYTQTSLAAHLCSFQFSFFMPAMPLACLPPFSPPSFALSRVHSVTALSPPAPAVATPPFLPPLTSNVNHSLQPSFHSFLAISRDLP